jgi:ABC-type antimicrobial peptide transport system, ATPase component
MNKIITLNRISKHFITSRKISVLNKINYKFVKGKIYSLTGPSGSGKSTLLNILSLIDRPSAGNLKINDYNVDFTDGESNDKIRSKKIGII